MTVEQFRKNVKGVNKDENNENSDFDPKMLEEIYNSIK